MAKINVFYRAFKEFRRQCDSDKELNEFRDAVKSASADFDLLRASRTYAIINEDWVNKLEEELSYVEKAVREDRQFIRQNGEVVPIEKVKRVSTQSVQHLARHSELVTKMPEEGEDLVPDKLYMVENLSNFAIYENKFLYMLLKIAEDFINTRLEKILELGRTYKAEMTVKKSIAIGKRHLEYEMKLRDEDKNDAMYDAVDEAYPVICKIKDQRYMVAMLLNTPLMQEVAKSPMLKPPITKTNVLRMNTNFKHAYELYTFLTSYTKPGYEIRERRNTYKPMSENLADDYSEIVLAQSILAYQYGNKMNDYLRETYKSEEERLEEERKRLEHEKILALKRRVEEMGIGIEEYVLMLEKRNASLENDHSKLDIAYERIDNLTEMVIRLQNNIDTLKKQRDELVAEEENMRASHALELENVQNDYAEKGALLEIEIAHKLQDKQAELDERFAEKLKLSELDFENRVRDVLAESSDIKNEMRELGRVLDAERARRVLLTAELNGIRERYKLAPTSEDFTSKEKFEELEEQFRMFSVFFKKHWKRTKKRIRKEILSVYPAKDNGLKKKSAEDEPQIPEGIADFVLEENPNAVDTPVTFADNSVSNADNDEKTAEIIAPLFLDEEVVPYQDSLPSVSEQLSQAELENEYPAVPLEIEAENGKYNKQ